MKKTIIFKNEIEIEEVEGIEMERWVVVHLVV
jgi:hypothetical protein